MLPLSSLSAKSTRPDSAGRSRVVERDDAAGEVEVADDGFHGRAVVPHRDSFQPVVGRDERQGEAAVVKVEGAYNVLGDLQ